MGNLTPKQEKFVCNLVKGMSQREAYKNSYSASKMKDNTIDRKAYELSSKGYIRTRYKELVEKAQDEAIISRKDLLIGLSKAFYMAIGEEETPIALKDRTPHYDENTGELIAGCFSESVIEDSGKNADLKAVATIAEKIAKLENWNKESKEENKDKTINITFTKAVKNE